ncbi:MFS general substrate transporter [Gonapodya prolifera JEL478]|uniref:MFS general substrate transporter n=1 Tax=Gonapodya prolifera (strain JEL478) TaxID=1344416 RepID=A0A139AQI5_GONPJ|nr:MFS general substrate transporter [Gonapodya prolifera JEL478]|eukprot:KXS18996.1 MFS general substrate transporter [Gonapodya prolifera JEL478]
MAASVDSPLRADSSPIPPLSASRGGHMDDAEDDTETAIYDGGNDDEARDPLLASSASRITTDWDRASPLMWRVAIPILVFTIGQLALWIPLQQLIIQWICDDVLPPTGSDLSEIDRCNAPIVQATAASWASLFSVSTALPPLLLVPVLGHLSDTRLGRTWLLALPVLGAIISDGAIVVITRAMNDAPGAMVLGYEQALWAILGVAVVGAFFGGAGAVSVAVMGMVADVTAVGDRTLVMGRIQAAFMLSLLLGPALGGILVKLTNSNLTAFYFAFICDVLVLAFIAAFVRDPPKRASSASPDLTPKPATAPAVGLWSRLRDATESLTSRGKWERTVLVLVVFLYTVGSAGGRSIMVLYTRLEFEWGAFELGLFISMLAVGEALALMVVLPRAVSWGERVLGRSYEVWFVRIGLLGDVVIYLIFAAAMSGWQMMAAGAILAPLAHSLGAPATRGLLSTLAGADAQARVFSALQVMEGVATILAQLTFPMFYGRLVQVRRERVVMVAASIVFVLGLLLSAAISTREVEKRKQEEQEKEERDLANEVVAVSGDEEAVGPRERQVTLNGNGEDV